MTDLRDMSDDDLDQHRRDVLKEIERRQKIEAIPAEIAALRNQYTAAGGDLADLNTGA